MNFGPLTLPGDSVEIMDRAHEVGLNFYDGFGLSGQKAGEWGLTATSALVARRNVELASGRKVSAIGPWLNTEALEEVLPVLAPGPAVNSS